MQRQMLPILWESKPQWSKSKLKKKWSKKLLPTLIHLDSKLRTVKLTSLTKKRTSALLRVGRVARAKTQTQQLKAMKRSLLKKNPRKKGRIWMAGCNGTKLRPLACSLAMLKLRSEPTIAWV